MEGYIFLMKDNEGEFNLRLSTVLSCIKLAEKNGLVPILKEEWWEKVGNFSTSTFLANEAVLTTDAIYDHSDCPHCEEQYVFEMQRGSHRFMIGFQTILACLAFAEAQHVIPKIEFEWWQKINCRYN